jgi:hypothetical protein
MGPCYISPINQLNTERDINLLAGFIGVILVIFHVIFHVSYSIKNVEKKGESAV